jgi:acyl-CoA thioesterase-2
LDAPGEWRISVREVTICHQHQNEERIVMSELPSVLQVKELESGRWAGPNPEKDPEGRDIVFSGQILGQTIMASSATVDGGKEIKSLHAVFARAGRYSAGKVELELEPMHAGRAWASQTVTAFQADVLLSRGLALLNAPEPDLMRHAPAMPDVPPPNECTSSNFAVDFPDAEVRPIDDPGAVTADGSPVVYFWFRMAQSYDSVAANQAIIAWTTPGFIIGAAIEPHRDLIDYGEAHRSISTGVISATVHFHEHADVSDWTLFVHEASYAGHGRVFGKGSVFTRDGVLAATFSQDSMARHSERALDWRKDM